MKDQFPLGGLCLCALGMVVVAPNVWWRVSGEENYSVVPGERVTEYGVGSCQRWAGFQCLSGCALQMTMSLGRMSCGFRSEICKTLLGFGLV